jgi:hypothetical protein
LQSTLPNRGWPRKPRAVLDRELEKSRPLF